MLHVFQWDQSRLVVVLLSALAILAAKPHH